MLVTRDVLVEVVRTARLAPLWCSGALSVLVLLVPAALGAELDILDATSALHLALVALLVGAAFVLDDPARTLTEVLPVSARRTAVVRMAVALFPVTAAWALLLWLAPLTVRSDTPYPRGGLVIEAYALLAWTWAVAARVGARRNDGSGSVAAAASLLVVATALTMLPRRWAFYLSPGAEGFSDSRWRWSVFLAAGVALLVAGIAPRRRSASLGPRPWRQPRRDDATAPNEPGRGAPSTRRPDPA